MTPDAPPPHQLVVFRLADALFAADVFAVERVLRHTPPRPIPDVPAWVAGVVDHRGRVVPVIDLRARFELPAEPPRPGTRLLVLHADGELVGVIVDAVTEVATVEAAEIEPPPPLFRGLAGEYLRGLVRRPAGLVVVLDIARLLGATGRLALVQVRGEAAAEVPDV